MSNTTLNLTTNSSAPGGPHGPPNWYEYPECAVAPYAFIFYFGAKVFNLAVGSPCNILVMWQIATKKSDTSTSDLFIFNLAIVDAYFCLMMPVELVNRLLLDNGRIWIFQRFGYGIKNGAPLFLVCICLDRYMAVVHPILFTRVRDNKIRIGISVVVWSFILAHAISTCTLAVVTISKIFSGIILFAFTVMVFCNISIMWALHHSVAGTETMHPVKKKAFRMVLTILTIIVANYLPPVALIPFVEYYTFVQYHCQIITSVFAIMDLSCSIEPLLYLTKMEGLAGRCCARSAAKKPGDAKV